MTEYLKNIQGGGLQFHAITMEGIAIGCHEDWLLPRDDGRHEEGTNPQGP